VRIQPVTVRGSRVSWEPFHHSPGLLEAMDKADIFTYISWIECGEYSAILFDGSLIQITCDVSRGRLIGHRYCYIPCPFALDPFWTATKSLVETVESLMLSDPLSVRLRSSVRFDFDPSAARVGHPASHMTINSSNCRIACAAPLHYGRFIDLVFRSFYPEIRSKHDVLFQEICTKRGGAKTILPEESDQMHIAWSM
jgi:hypothetical protein